MTSRICVVGAGRWGRNHIRTLHQLGALAGIVDSDEAAVRELAGEYPDARTFTNIKDAAAAGFDGFTVATPAETHYEIGRFLLERAFPVLIEKPMALRAAEARELRDLASEKKAPLMVGHVMLFHPAIVEMKRLIEAGKIGRLEYLYSNRLNLGTVRTEENILWSFAPHDLSIFQSLIGTLPTEVLSRGGAYLQPLIHDTTMTILTYPNNIVGHIFVSWLHPFKEHRLMAIGSKGMLSFEDSAEDRRLLFYEKGIDWVQGEPIKRDGPTETISYEATPPLERELRYFIERIGDRGPVEVAGPESAIEVLEILERASESLIGPAAPGADVSGRASSSASSDHRYFVHESSFVDDDVEIGDGTKIWHFSHVQSGVRIGRACSIGQNVNIGNNVRIGNNVKIQNNVSVYEGVELEDYVFCGPSMVFTNVNDPRSKYPQRGAEHYSKTLVREGASIGANATIVCGNTIGRHAFVAAGAVVTHHVPDYALVAGIPARRRDWVCECGEVLPPVSDDMTCPRCERRYRLADGRLHPQ